MRARRFSATVTASICAVALLTACAPGPTGAEPATTTPVPSASAAPPSTTAEPPAPRDVVTVHTTGLRAPWSIAFHDGSALVSERDSARILELDADGTAREVGVIEGVVHGGEGGLLGIAAHEGDLYVYSTGGDGNRIERYPLHGDPGMLSLGPAQTLLSGIPSARVHNGGRLAFGPDGMLYATTGDAGSPARAQDLGSSAGKILRMTPDGAAPADNPFPDSRVYSYGHRNPQGLAWGDDGTLYASEFGQNTWDELNVIVPGGNYGWPEVEGIAGREGFIDPVQQWAPADASPSGIAIADDAIFIANLRGQRLRQVPLSDVGASNELFVGEFGRLRDVALAPDGALWVLTNNTDGRGSPGPDDDRIIRLSR